MPQSKKRGHHHQQTPPPHKVNGRKNHAIIYVSVIFFALLGMGIIYFAAGIDTVSLSLGAVFGAITGYFFGYMIDRSLSK